MCFSKPINKQSPQSLLENCPCTMDSSQGRDSQLIKVEKINTKLLTGHLHHWLAILRGHCREAAERGLGPGVDRPRGQLSSGCDHTAVLRGSQQPLLPVKTIKPVSILSWRRRRFTYPCFPNWETTDKGWLLGEGVSVCFKGVAAGRSIRLQGMPPLLWADGQLKLDLVSYYIE